MLGRIDAVVPAGEHRDRSGRKRRTVRRRVDAAREARDHGEAGLAELACDALGEFHAGAGGVARTDDGDHRQRERRRLAADCHEGRRVVDHLQPRRIAGFAQRHERDKIERPWSEPGPLACLISGPRKWLNWPGPNPATL